MLGLTIGIIGAVGIVASTLFVWGSSVKEKFGEVMTDLIGGIELLPGQIAAGAGILAFILLFVRRKLAVIPGVIALGMTIWFLIDINGTVITPGAGLWQAIAGSVMVIVGGMMPARKKG